MAGHKFVMLPWSEGAQVAVRISAVVAVLPRSWFGPDSRLPGMAASTQSVVDTSDKLIPCDCSVGQVVDELRTPGTLARQRWEMEQRREVAP